jgi:phosphoglucosamine mutase
MMSKKYFGTDGVRGEANRFPMTPMVALKLGQAIAQVCSRDESTKRIIIGKDTRRSSYMIEQAIAAGVCSMGSNAVLTGPLPTPGVAFLTSAMRADAGIMISASHNSFGDNGIKFFTSEGYKLTDEQELEIERLLDGGLDDIELPTGAQVGKAFRIDDAPGRYMEFVKKSFPSDLSLDGLKVVIDCANGAAYKIAPQIFWELGAEVVSLHVEPNGLNINKNGGATSVQKMSQFVQETKADIGVALDGDADRVVLCDHEGHMVDGDKLIALCAEELKQEGQLDNSGVVGTIMTNQGVENYLKSQGIQVERTAVGDRYIIERMREKGYVLGGEPSGHVIFSKHSTTGDGLIAALQVMARMQRLGKSLQSLSQGIPLYPQAQESIRVKKKTPLEDIPGMTSFLSEVDTRLGTKGRMVVRYSGTEPVLRVMIEAENESLVKKELGAVSSSLKKSLAS